MYSAIRNKDSPITSISLINDLTTLGILPGDTLVVTSSLRSIGKVEGGARTILECLLDVVGPQGSIFGLSFTPSYRLPLSRIDAAKVFTRTTPTYTGTLNTLLLRTPSSLRSTHPTNSFVGLGPMAHALLPAHTPFKPSFDPIYHLAQHTNTYMLLLGTVDACPGVTTVHVAQNLLAFRNTDIGKQGVNYLDHNNDIRLYVHNDVGGCSRGFWKFYDYYRKAGASKEGMVGNAYAMLVNLNASLRIDLDILKENPGFFFCDNFYCYPCRCSWEFSPKTLLSFSLKLFYSIFGSVLQHTTVKHTLTYIVKRTHKCAC